jgi:hypothetical protein
MADLHVEWSKPIKLAREGRHSLVFNMENVPPKPGVYVFFRREDRNTTRAIYVGCAQNLQRRTANHANNHSLITELRSRKGTYYLMPGTFKARPSQIAKTSIKTIERVIMRSCLEDGHPLINVSGMRIRARHVLSSLPAGAKWLQTSIGFEH